MDKTLLMDIVRKYKSLLQNEINSMENLLGDNNMDQRIKNMILSLLDLSLDIRIQQSAPKPENITVYAPPQELPESPKPLGPIVMPEGKKEKKKIGVAPKEVVIADNHLRIQRCWYSH